MPADQIQYSEKYNDDKYEYRNTLRESLYIIFLSSLFSVHLKVNNSNDVCSKGGNNLELIYFLHVILPIDLARHVPKTHLMSETEWRNLGVQQSPGWVHYMMHVPGIKIDTLVHEPHVLLFRRPRTDVLTNTRNNSFEREYQSVYCV